MLQNRQNGTQTQMPVLPFSNANFEVSIDQGDMLNTLKTVTCPICQATYIPSSQQRASAQGSFVLLETAFLCVCHFCFRCHRPACPQCWNPVHNVCVACGEEGHLPFLSPVPSLEGLVISPPDPLPGAQTGIVPFTCLSNGHFYATEREPHNQGVNPTRIPSSSNPIIALTLPTIQSDDISSATTSPAQIEKLFKHRIEQSSESLLSQQVDQPIDHQYISAFCRVPDPGHIPVSPLASQLAWSPVTSPSPPLPQPSLSGEDKQMTETLIAPHPAESTKRYDFRTLVERIENILIALISIILIGLVLMIVLATSSATMNAFFLQLLHIDIRGEISYLFQIL